jgi:hypothetical protein
MKRIVTLLIIALSLGLYSYSQGTLRGKIVDSASQKPLSLATISVFRAADTALITYRMTSPEGEFKVPNLPLDLNCRVVISFSGYGVYRKEFTVTAAQSIIDLGSINLNPDAKSLDEVLVIAERPPVVVKKDTIEFNASAFKTLPNALVEDLLKKLPGVQVDRDGNILVNGKPVNRILVDGKVFFGDDPRMATRNLPANVIDKVQVTDDKEEMLRNGDDNINNVGKVVNITLKKGVKKGWFGKLYAGGGTDKLYEAGAIANMYRDTFQVSVLGYANNLNKAGFSYNEILQAGGFERNRSNLNGNSTSIWNNGAGGSGLSINGVNFGGSQNYGGVSTSRGGGININHAPSSKRSFFVQYFRGNVNIERRTFTDTKQYSADTVVNTTTDLDGPVVTNGHVMGLGARFKPDSVTNILVNAQLTLGKSDEDKINDMRSVNNHLGDLSAGDVVQNNLGKTRFLRQSFTMTKLSRKKAGRRYTIFQNLDINNRLNDLFTESDIRYYHPNVFDSVYGQLRTERIPRTDAYVQFNYSEPITKKLTFRAGGRYEYGELRNEINTYNKNGGAEYDVLNPQLSSQFKRNSHRAMFSPGLEFKRKDLTITPGLRILMQDVDNNLASLPKSIHQKQTNLLPTLGIVYKLLTFNYNRDIVLPFYTNLIPVGDNTNPYFISKGNPNLLPMRRDNISINYYFNNPKTYMNIGGSASASFTDNDVVQSITVDEKGVQTTMPVNADGSRNFYMNFNVRRQYKNNPKLIFSWNTGNNFNYNHNRLLYNGTESWQTTVGYSHWFGLTFSFNDKVELNSNYSIYHNFTNYTNPRFKKLEVTNHWFDNELVVRYPKHVIWETQFNYNYNGSIGNGMPKGVARWHAAVNLTMLKNEAGVLKLSVFDILNRNNNIWVNANRNMITSQQTNVLGQYFMATFTYNVRAAGASKRVGGRERLFFF